MKRFERCSSIFVLLELQSNTLSTPKHTPLPVTSRPPEPATGGSGVDECVSPACYAEVYAATPLEPGEVDQDRRISCAAGETAAEGRGEDDARGENQRSTQGHTGSYPDRVFLRELKKLHVL